MSSGFSSTTIRHRLLLGGLLLGALLSASPAALHRMEALQQPAASCSNPPTQAGAQSVHQYQTKSGGWPRNREMTLPHGADRPIFTGREKFIHTNLAEIESERRAGYKYCTDAPARPLDQACPAWSTLCHRPGRST